MSPRSHILPLACANEFARTLISRPNVERLISSPRAGLQGLSPADREKTIDRLTRETARADDARKELQESIDAQDVLHDALEAAETARDAAVAEAKALREALLVARKWLEGWASAASEIGFIDDALAQFADGGK